MKNTTVYLIRHSVRFKSSNIIKYNTNQDNLLKNEKIILSVEGEKRAEILSNEAELQNLDVVYTSNSVRTLQTAKYILEKHGNNGAMSTMASLPASRKNAILQFVSSRVADVAKKYNLEQTMSSGRISKTQQVILHYAAFHGGRVENAKALCASLDIPWITAIRNIGALVSMGKIERIGSKKTGHWKLR